MLPICLPSIIRFRETDFSNRFDVQLLDIKTRAALSRMCIFSMKEGSKQDASQRACSAYMQFPITESFEVQFCGRYKSRVA